MFTLRTNFVKARVAAGLFSAFLIVFFALGASAQEPTAQPTPDEPIRISTEEVHLNVTAQTASGKFVPTLTADDLLVVEEGDPQKITSMKRVPASVLLLLDTGSELNYAKQISTTRLLALLLVEALAREHQMAVMQYYNKIELISDWTTDPAATKKALDTKMYGGKRVRFAEALSAAAETFKTRPVENRHIVLISDGVENVVDDAARRVAIEKLVAANITVHVLSYTQLESRLAQKASAIFRVGDGKTKPQVDPFIWDNIVDGLLVGVNGDPSTTARIKAQLKMLNESQAMVVVNIDRERSKRIEKQRDEWEASEARMQTLAEDTGGIFQAPETPETMFRLAIETANAINFNYVITYAPSKAVAGSEENKPRKVRVSTHCDGVYIRSRQKVVWNPAQ